MRDCALLFSNLNTHPDPDHRHTPHCRRRRRRVSVSGSGGSERGVMVTNDSNSGSSSSTPRRSSHSRRNCLVGTVRAPLLPVDVSLTLHATSDCMLEAAAVLGVSAFACIRVGFEHRLKRTRVAGAGNVGDSVSQNLDEDSMSSDVGAFRRVAAF